MIGNIQSQNFIRNVEICQDDFVYFDGGIGYKVKRTTEKAVLIVVNRGDNVPRLFDIWLPRNCFDIIRTIEYHDTREVYCKDLSRWAMQKIKGY